MDNKLPFWMRVILGRLLENELIRRIARNSAYLFSATGISVALSFFQNILATRILGVYYLGVLGAIVKFTSVINKLISFRMGELVIKYVGDYTERGDHERAAAVFKAASLLEIIASIIAYGVIFLLAPLGARFFAKDIQLVDLFTLYGLIVVGNLMLESATGLLQILDQFHKLAWIQIVQSMLTLVLIFVVYIRGGGLMQVILAYMVGKVVNSAGVTLVAVIEAGRRWGRNWWHVPLHTLSGQTQDLFRFAFSTNISATINLVNKDSEELWVAFFRSPLEAGYYKQALALSNLVLLPITPLPQATYPELSREVSKHNWKNVRYVLRQGSRLAASYTSLAIFVLAVFGKPMISLLYGDSFLPAYPALLILLIGFLIANTFYWNRTALLALSLPDYPTKVNFSAAMIKVTLALLLIPKFGYLISAGLLAGYYAFSVGLNVRRTYQELRMRTEEESLTLDGAGV